MMNVGLRVKFSSSTEVQVSSPSIWWTLLSLDSVMTRDNLAATTTYTTTSTSRVAILAPGLRVAVV